MEDLFELIVAAVAVAIGLALKSTKKKNGNVKARRNAASDSADGFDWDEIEQPDVKQAEAQPETLIPYAPSVPAAKPAPAIIQPELAATVKAAINAATAGAAPKPRPARPEAAHPEGCHSEEGPASGHHPKTPQPRPKAAQKRAEAPKSAFAKPASSPQHISAAPGRVTAAQLRRAVVMSEVLDRPVALRRVTPRR